MLQVAAKQVRRYQQVLRIFPLQSERRSLVSFPLPAVGLVQVAAAGHIHGLAAEKLHHTDPQLRSHAAEKRHVRQAFAPFPLGNRFVGHIPAAGLTGLG